MKNNIRLSVLFAAIAVVVAGIGLDSSPVTEDVTSPRASSWASAFPVAQAGFASPAPAAH